MTGRLVVTAFAVAALASCTHTRVAPGGADALADLMRIDGAGGAAAARRDAAAVLGGYADDIVYCGSRGAALGADGIAVAWKPWFSANGPLVTWSPERGGVATSGDVGWTTGSSRVELKDAEGKPKLLTSAYVTVWSRGDGGWKGALDLAVGRPAAELDPGERLEVRTVRSAAGDVEAEMGLWRRASAEPPRAGGYLTVRRRRADRGWEVVEDRVSPFAGAAPPGELVLLDAAWSRTVARGDADRFREIVGDRAVFAGGTLRRGRDEVWDGWKSFFAEGGPTIRWTPTDAGVAGSGDLAWTTGRARLERRGPDGKAIGKDTRYVTVWTREAGGPWRATLDASLEAPESLGPIEREVVHSVVSADGTLEAAIGTWTQPASSGIRRGAWLTVREKVDGAWRTRLDSAFAFPPRT